ncbi:hypothetical protein DAEQUDRAFT_720508 [Daedalea quercina L-15889]|uniref:Uncharacterized protein n=1 Tax=Daedalea quercina L-15889 TaxID=1314783 RepID=A0A165U3G4_9APHY|nr:hypothetical protein DAEQUDRAFT_720508 [Daedalea quercina L-15889]
MDYRPRYAQPFTLREAVRLDVSVITEEMARLQNSLQHLRRTQTELRNAADAAPDPEFTKAIEENDIVIGSQEERISILTMALTEKGVAMSSHYGMAQPTSLGDNDTEYSTSQPAGTSPTSTQSPVANTEPIENADDGIFL